MTKKILDKPVAKQDRLSLLKRFFKDRTPVPESSFTDKVKKDKGSSAGYIAEDEGVKLMVKKGVPVASQKVLEEQLATEDAFAEFILAPLYQRILYDRAPTIALVKTADKSIALRSKFLPEFQTIGDFLASQKSVPGSNREKLKDVEGAEKLFAALLFLGEIDPNIGNIGIMKTTETSIDISTGAAQTKEKRVFAKIDHGKSGLRQLDDELDVRKFFFDKTAQHGYDKTINFDPSKFSAAIAEFATVSDDEITKMIRNRTSQLKSAGVSVKDLSFSLTASPKFSNFEGLEKFFIDRLIKNRDSVIAFGKTLAVLSKLEKQELLGKGEWLESFDILDIPEYLKRAENIEKLELQALDKIDTSKIDKLEADPAVKEQLKKDYLAHVRQDFPKMTDNFERQGGGLLVLSEDRLKEYDQQLDKLIQAKGRSPVTLAAAAAEPSASLPSAPARVEDKKSPPLLSAASSSIPKPSPAKPAIPEEVARQAREIGAQIQGDVVASSKPDDGARATTSTPQPTARKPSEGRTL